MLRSASPPSSSGPMAATVCLRVPCCRTIMHPEDLHWQNAVVDTVSSFAKDGAGGRRGAASSWKGRIAGGRRLIGSAGIYPPTRGSSAEQGDNEHIPPYESLRNSFRPTSCGRLTTPGTFHAGASDGNNSLEVFRRRRRRYGPARSAEEFAARPKSRLRKYASAIRRFRGNAGPITR